MYAAEASYWHEMAGAPSLPRQCFGASFLATTWRGERMVGVQDAFAGQALMTLNIVLHSLWPPLAAAWRQDPFMHEPSRDGRVGVTDLPNCGGNIDSHFVCPDIGIFHDGAPASTLHIQEFSSGEELQTTLDPRHLATLTESTGEAFIHYPTLSGRQCHGRGILVCENYQARGRYQKRAAELTKELVA